MTEPDDNRIHAEPIDVTASAQPHGVLTTEPNAEGQSARDKFIDVLYSRRMMQPGEEWVIDVNLNAYAHELVAATLRAVAEQVASLDDRASLLETAERVKAGEHDSVCPLCQEVACDSGCPLSGARAAWARQA